MKMFKTMVALVVICASFLVVSVDFAQAIPKWYVVNVRLIGQAEAGKIVIQLNEANGAFNNLNFVPAAGSEDRFIGLAVVSKVNNIPLLVFTDIDVGPRVIQKLFLGP